MKPATRIASPAFVIAGGRYETNGFVGTRAGHVLADRLRRAGWILCGSAAPGPRSWCCRLRPGTRLRVDRWLLGLARALRLGPRLLGSAAASAFGLGSRP